MIIRESLIELHAKSKTKNEIIENLAQKAQELGRISDITSYIQAVLAVEETSPTAFGYEIGIPYAKSSDVLTPFIAFARSEEELMWDSRLDHKVKLIFLIGVPEEQEEDLDFTLFMQIYGGLTNESYRRRLLQADNATQVLAVFEDMGI